MLGAFRVENALGMYVYALLTAALAYASSVPTPATRVGVDTPGDGGLSGEPGDACPEPPSDEPDAEGGK